MSKKQLQTTFLWMTFLTIILILSACSTDDTPAVPLATLAIPTIDPLFSGVTVAQGNSADVVAEPTKVAIIAATPIPLVAPPTVQLPPPIPIYDDQLNVGWSAKYSSMPYQLDYDLETFEGTHAIRLIPQVGGRVLFFTLDKNARPLREDRVLGIRFQLYSGDEGLSIDEFGMAIIGSDSNTFWVKNDNSAVNIRNPNPDWVAEDDPISNLYAQTFSETTLGFLEVPRDIPPNTWVEAFNELDNRKFDPLYRSIVGFYFKTELSVRHELLIDNIELVVLGEAEQ